MVVAKPTHLMSSQMPHHPSLLRIHLLAPISGRALGRSRLFPERFEWYIDIPLPRPQTQRTVRIFADHICWGRGCSWVLGDGAARGRAAKTYVAGSC